MATTLTAGEAISVRRPDEMAIVRCAGYIATIFLEIDGWRICGQRMRPRIQPRHMGDETATLRRVRAKRGLESAIPFVSHLLVINESSSRTSGLLAEAVQGYQYSQPRTSLLDAELALRTGIMPSPWERVSDGACAPSREYVIITIVRRQPCIKRRLANLNPRPFDTMEATEKQKKYIFSLLARAGFSTEWMDASFDKLGATMRQRSGTVKDWVNSLTVSQASKVINELKEIIEKNEAKKADNSMSQ